MPQHNAINYVELPAQDLSKIKAFYSQVFGWDFVDYGPEYVAISGGGLDGGFYQSNQSSKAINGSVLVVIYSDDLEASLASVESAGGCVVKNIFAFPGGRRFHFEDPCGNELAVWSDG